MSISDHAEEQVEGVCHFCKSLDLRVLEIDVIRWAVYCPTCGTIGPHGRTPVKAISFWQQAKIHS